MTYCIDKTDFEADTGMTIGDGSERPPQQTIDFALNAEEKLRLAWLRKNKKMGEKGSIASASDLAAMFMSAESEPISEEANQQASAGVSAGLDDFLNEFSLPESSKTKSDVKIINKTVELAPASKSQSTDAFKDLDDFLN